ncbi:TRAP transporter small permease subunit [uncultured Marinobacter sp.]|jgi:TRAP-type C4-dicarboxylate transport system permease small subunit|uniref:TRAP transporter small permease n=1 Tax=uncultured Marinobacter sp. TaxID=187379 RepID=UPI000C10C5AC|nr:TRAP transporter small permease subunit [uncultured Marinobacter sp.]MBI46282.1 C4-dicarboxylate ABC transporter permease [Marinobacter sp.]PHS47528.1 MAG: C4-dicarboxylate ABC transporter permease [Marinobacter sp.]HAS77106.1 C4-dicarboxylate ABC transporter permease [Marinobacter adhaerens]HBX42003.1 C4-dicarboxylate ABC transporter permease [Marinobacter adhaerens]|tara:strand:- start:5909 stop:6454 length:546 start_codon:yes stop_codon:yes gene_type:complete
MLKAVSDFVARIEAVIAASLAGAVTLLILLNIITRSAGYAIYWVDELAIYCMIWMTFFATSVLLKRRESVAVNLLTEYVKGSTRTVLAKFSDLMVLLFGGILAWLSWRWYDPFTLYQVGFDLQNFQAETFNFMYAENTSTLGIKKFWVWMILPILSITLTLHGLANLLSSETAPEQSVGMT